MMQEMPFLGLMLVYRRLGGDRQAGVHGEVIAIAREPVASAIRLICRCVTPNVERRPDQISRRPLGPGFW